MEATLSQEKPTVGQVEVLNFIRSSLPEPEYAEILADLEARQALGIEKYGSPLMTFNGRVATVDKLQELEDALMYSFQEFLECDGDDEDNIAFECIVITNLILRAKKRLAKNAR